MSIKEERFYYIFYENILCRMSCIHQMFCGEATWWEILTNIYCVTLCDTVWHCVTLCDTVWHCVTLCDTVRCYNCYQYQTMKWIKEEDGENVVLFVYIFHYKHTHTHTQTHTTHLCYTETKTHQDALQFFVYISGAICTIQCWTVTLTTWLRTNMSDVCYNS